MGRKRSVPTPILLVLLLAAAPRLTAAGEERLYLSFLGDIMVHKANVILGDYERIFAPLAPILLRDTLSFANLEFPVLPGRGYSSYPCFNGPPEYVRAAALAGIDVFSLANNHAFDQGLQGLRQTHRVLEHVERQVFRRIYAQGTRDSLEEPFAPAEILAGGVRIGFLAVTQTVNQPQPGPYVQVVDYTDARQRGELLEMVRDLAPRFDLFILSYHGGREYARQPEEEQVRFFHELVEAGVDVVYGHHPHVLQRYELVDRPEGPGLILYSTGNLISGMTWDIDPGKPDDPLAWTGDSALWLVVVQVEGQGPDAAGQPPGTAAGQPPGTAAAPRTCAVQSVVPLPLSNVRDRRGQTSVYRYGCLGAAELSRDWVRYFRARQSSLRTLLRRWDSLQGPGSR